MLGAALACQVSAGTHVYAPTGWRCLVRRVCWVAVDGHVCYHGHGGWYVSPPLNTTLPLVVWLHQPTLPLTTTRTVSRLDCTGTVTEQLNSLG